MSEDLNATEDSSAPTNRPKLETREITIQVPLPPKEPYSKDHKLSDEEIDNLSSGELRSIAVARGYTRDGAFPEVGGGTIRTAFRRAQQNDKEADSRFAEIPDSAILREYPKPQDAPKPIPSDAGTSPGQIGPYTLASAPETKPPHEESEGK